MSATAEKTTESRDLIVVRQLTPAIFADSASVEDVLAKLEREVRAFPRDISTAARREANTRHRSKINGAARDGLVKIGLTIEQGTAVVTAIAKGEVPNVSISY